jgi:hypothetical protein
MRNKLDARFIDIVTNYKEATWVRFQLLSITNKRP